MRKYEMKIYFDNGEVHRETVAQDVKDSFTAELGNATGFSVHKEYCGFYLDLTKISGVTFSLVEREG